MEEKNTVARMQIWQPGKVIHFVESNKISTTYEKL